MTTLELQRCVVRNTGSQRGRHRSVAPGATSARYLHYGRIVLAEGDEGVQPEFAAGGSGLEAGR